MRQLCTLLILSLLAVGTGCTKDKFLTEVNGQSIVGEWELVEYNLSIGIPGTWYPATSEESFVINADGSYTSEPSKDFFGTNGRFKLLNDSTLAMFKTISSSGEPVETDLTRFGNFELSADGNFITIWNMLCVEGCGSKFRKVK